MWVMLLCLRCTCIVIVQLELIFVIFFFKQKTAYEMRISDWSSDVCSSDLADARIDARDDRKTDRLGNEGERDDDPSEDVGARGGAPGEPLLAVVEIGRASCRERVCQYV